MQTDTHHRQDEKDMPSWLVAVLVALLLAFIGFSIWVAMTSDSVMTWPTLMY